MSQIVGESMIKILSTGLLCLGLLTGCWDTEHGEKSGVLVKITKEGAFWSTYEGEIVRGGFQDGSGVNGSAYVFSMGPFENELVLKSKQYMQKSTHVVIQYHCEAFVAPWRGSSDCFLDDIHES